MYLPPLNITDLSLLFSLGAIFLLITDALLSPYYGQTNILINKKKLRKSALIVSILFFIIFIIRLIAFLINS